MYRHISSCLEGHVSRSTSPSPCLFGNVPTAAEPSARRPEHAPIRKELVLRVRREIAAGIYDTPEKWFAALAQLSSSLGCP
jgi:hypothetical protein